MSKLIKKASANRVMEVPKSILLLFQALKIFSFTRCILNLHVFCCDPVRVVSNELACLLSTKHLQRRRPKLQDKDPVYLSGFINILVQSLVWNHRLSCYSPLSNLK